MKPGASSTRSTARYATVRLGRATASYEVRHVSAGDRYAASPAAGYTDGYIFGIIRNGKGLMPSYNRIEEPDRWDIVNYLRSLQGKIAIAADTSHGRPGETGALVPGASTMGPTRPAPYYHPSSAAAAPAAPAAPG